MLRNKITPLSTRLRILSSPRLQMLAKLYRTIVRYEAPTIPEFLGSDAGPHSSPEHYDSPPTACPRTCTKFSNKQDQHIAFRDPNSQCGTELPCFRTGFSADFRYKQAISWYTVGLFQYAVKGFLPDSSGNS